MLNIISRSSDGGINKKNRSVFRTHSIAFVQCSGSALRRSPDDQTRAWTIALAKDGFMSSAMFVINVWDGVCPKYYTLNQRFDNLSGSLLFCLLDKLFYAVE